MANNKVQTDLLKDVETLQKRFDELSENPACWKSARKLEAVTAILTNEWREPEPKPAAAATAPATEAKSPKAKA